MDFKNTNRKGVDNMKNTYKKQIGGDHYRSMKIQASEFINKNNLPFAEGNAIKYLCRHKSKGQREDLLKAIHYVILLMSSEDKDKEKPDVGIDVDAFNGS